MVHVNTEISDQARIVIGNLKSRWSCRIFNNEQVPRQVIEILLDTANHAPSPKNCQPWEFIVLTGDPLHRFHESISEWLKEKEYMNDSRDELKKLLPDGEYLTTIPKDLLQRQKVFLNNLSGQLDAFGIRLKDVYKNTFYFHYAPTAILVISHSVKRDRHGLEVHQAAAAAVQNILLAAHALGYGSCWIGDILRFGKRLNTYFEIDEKKEVVAGIAIGRPGMSVGEVSEKLARELEGSSHIIPEAEISMEPVQKQPLDGKVRFMGF